MSAKITAEESAQMRKDSAALGVTFDDCQWQRVILAVERRLERAERVWQKELEQAKEQLRKQFDREYSEVLEKSDRLTTAATQVKALVDSAKEYELMHQGHFEHVDQEDSRPA